MPDELAERLIEPRIPASKLRDSSHRSKIKLRAAGFRLVYDVRDFEVLVLVVAVGKRELNAGAQCCRPPGRTALKPDGLLGLSVSA